MRNEILSSFTQRAQSRLTTKERFIDIEFYHNRTEILVAIIFIITIIINPNEKCSTGKYVGLC